MKLIDELFACDECGGLGHIYGEKCHWCGGDGKIYVSPPAVLFVAIVIMFIFVFGVLWLA